MSRSSYVSTSRSVSMLRTGGDPTRQPSSLRKKKFGVGGVAGARPPAVAPVSLNACSDDGAPNRLLLADSSVSRCSSRTLRMRSHVTVLYLLVFAVALPACMAFGKNKKERDGDEEADALNIGRMEKARAQAMAAPGASRDADLFAGHVAFLWSSGTAEQRKLPPTLVDDAIGLLDRARAAHPEEAHALLARKGEVLLAAKRRDAGLAALRESIDARPNLRAFEQLAKAYSEQNQGADVEVLCKLMRPAMT